MQTRRINKIKTNIKNNRRWKNKKNRMNKKEVIKVIKTIRISYWNKKYSETKIKMLILFEFISETNSLIIRIFLLHAEILYSLIIQMIKLDYRPNNRSSENSLRKNDSMSRSKLKTERSIN